MAEGNTPLGRTGRQTGQNVSTLGTFTRSCRGEASFGCSPGLCSLCHYSCRPPLCWPNIPAPSLCHAHTEAFAHHLLTERPAGGLAGPGDSLGDQPWDRTSGHEPQAQKAPVSEPTEPHCPGVLQHRRPSTSPQRKKTLQCWRNFTLDFENPC